MHPFFLSNQAPITPCDRYKNPYHGTEVLRFTDVTADDCDRYCKALEVAGFTAYRHRTLADNRFATYITPQYEAHLAFYPALGEMRAVSGARTYLPPLESPVFEAIQAPTLSQIKLSIVGQSNAVQLADGGFLLIDGGMDDEGDRAYLLDFLYQRKPAHHEKPHIAAWLISHCHNDHIYLCQEFLKAYHDRVEVALFGYNFPDYTSPIVDYAKPAQRPRTVHWQTEMRRIIHTYFPTAKRWETHSGDTLHLPGCDVDIMITWEDFWPHKMVGVNDTATAFRLRFAGGKTAMLPTDAWFGMCDQMVSVYGNALKSDILQPVHHGTAGGMLDFYQRVSPEITLWPAPAMRPPAPTMTDLPPLVSVFDYAKEKFPESAWLLDHAKRHYHNSETVTINMETLETTIY
jgi:beta-lactamase superfamily II metal-dependent hydrolase